MFRNVASQKVIVFAFDSTTNAPKTGDAANITAYISKDFGSVTALTDTSATEMDATNAKGYYLFDITQTETNADILLVSAKSTTANIVVVGAPAAIFTFPTTGILAPATAGRTLSVDASGRGLADVDTVKTQAVTCAAGVTILASVGTAATSTAQTGDAYASLTGAQAEPGQGAPAANASIATKIAYLYKLMRNKITQTSTTLSVYDDAGSTVDQKATVSDDGTTYTRGEIGSGP